MEMSVSVVTPSRPETTAQVTRGAARLLVALGYAPLAEVTLPNGRRTFTPRPPVKPECIEYRWPS